MVQLGDADVDVADAGFLGSGGRGAVDQGWCGERLEVRAEEGGAARDGVRGPVSNGLKTATKLALAGSVVSRAGKTILLPYVYRED